MTPVKDPRSVSHAIKRRAREIGFDLVGIAPAKRPPHARFYLDWLKREYHGEMTYLARPDAVKRRVQPGEALPGARSIIVVALNYANSIEGAINNPSRPIISQYARATDYHTVFEEKLERLANALRSIVGDFNAKLYVDYGPVMERDHAQRAGLGWIGKNTLLINPRLGSYTFLGEILTDVALEPDDAFEPDHCGTCDRCIWACPTGAIAGPRELDARLCISYLTIELRGPIPIELRPLIGNRVFGCDICQEVCPWNKAAPETQEPRFKPRDDVTGAELIDLIGLSEEAFQDRFGDTPIARPKRRGFLRNVAVALGNWGSRKAVPALTYALGDDDPLIRGHAAWALGRIAGAEAAAALEARLAVEDDGWVRTEIGLALQSEPVRA